MSLTSVLPVIVYAPRGVPKKHAGTFRGPFPSFNLHVVSTQDGLLDAAALVLHRRLSDLPEAEKAVLQRGERKDTILSGMKVAIIDDDIRNIFALASVLERYGIDVAYAEDGNSGIRLLQETPNVDVVLVDIMMPEMDGYETMRQIRAIDQFSALPLIAVTAKAMREDREKCFEAGASDYLSKPVDTERLLSILRTSIYTTRAEAAE